jgi:cyclase
MLAKRIIPCLDIKDGRTVKGTNFVNLRDAGNPVELANMYSKNGADELVFLDITATNENRKTLLNLVDQVSRQINIPFTVGGGISSVADVELLLRYGADKISINSAAVKTPQLVTDIAKQFGSQCVVVAVDTRNINGIHYVHTHGGKYCTALQTIAWCNQLEQLGAGEILLTSMNKDGTKDGFDLDITKQIATGLQIPVIASGGAGKAEHFIDVFQTACADAALAASIFHFKEVDINDLKYILAKHNIPVR